MKTVPVHEAEARLSELLAAVELGEEITITRHGRPVARIVAVADTSAVAHGFKGRLEARENGVLGDFFCCEKTPCRRDENFWQRVKTIL